MVLPVTFAVAGTSLSEEEARFFEQNKPFGFILFKRNVDHPEQLKTLINDLKRIAGPDTHILVDQEGGRVQRLTEPHWPKYPCMQKCQNEETLKTTISSIAKDLTEIGIDINCAPVLDILQENTDVSIGDRAFSDNPSDVAKLGHIACKTFLENNIQPIIKHLPGHGRAIVDSHDEIPFVTAELDILRKTDFLPFEHVLRQFYPYEIWGMVGHCIYTDIDPDLPASLSPKIIGDVIREEIGLSDMLFSDDLSMGALSAYGDIGTRTKLCLDAGCDIALYCAGKLEDMQQIASKLS